MAVKVTETAKDKQIRLASDKKLSDLRSFITSENSDVYSSSKELLEFSKRMRKVSMFDLARELVDAVIEISKLENVEIDSLRVITPASSKVLTKIIKLKEELSVLDKIDGSKLSIGQKDKFKKLWAEVKDLNNKFEIELRTMYDSMEALLNSLLLSTDIVYGYSESLTLCYQHNILTTSQYNIIKMLGRVRNLFMHNSSSYLMLKNVTVDQLYLFKAVILEARTAIFKLMLEHSDKMYTFGGYLKAVTLMEEGESLSKEIIDMCHTLYAEMVVNDTLKGITLVRELYSVDELENGYIKNVYS